MGIGKYVLKVTREVFIDGENIFEITAYDKFPFSVSDNPFGNCQTWAIRNFNWMLRTVDIKDIKSVIIQLKEICRIGKDKPLLMVDVDKRIFLQLKKYVTFYDYNEYLNTSGNRMYLCMIKANDSELNKGVQR